MRDFARAALAQAQPSLTDERAAFEAWVKAERGSPWPIALDRADTGNYLYLPACEAWEVWRARAALATQAAQPEGLRHLPEQAIPEVEAMSAALKQADAQYRRMMWQRGYDFALAQRAAGKTDSEIYAMQRHPLTEFDAGVVAALKVPK